MPRPHTYTARDGRVTWKVRFRLGGRNCQETFDTERQAKAFCADIETRDVRYALRLLHATESESTLTLDRLAEQFFTWKTADPEVRSDRTVADYRRDYRNWIAPTLGQLPAAFVDERAVQEWVDAMIAGTLGRKALSTKSVIDRHSILYSIYAWGLVPARRLVDHNPCQSTRLPRRRAAPPKGLRPAEWQALYAAMAQIDPDAADLAEFLLASGWRVSESSALSAFDVEDDGADVYVNMGRVLRRNAAGQHVIVEDAKSEAGLRRIRLDEQAGEMVRRRLERVHGDGLVFTTKQGSQWHYSNFLNRFWKPAVRAAGLSRNPTPHWLRHTSVYWMVANRKASLAEIQRRLGHKHISTTIDVYGRMVDDVSDEALAAFAAMRQPATGRAIRGPRQDVDQPGGAAAISQAGSPPEREA